jgi:hypothetical protein
LTPGGSSRLSGAIAEEKETPAVPRAEARASNEARFGKLVALTIALVSVLGAIVAFTANTQDREARRLDREVIQQTQRREQITSDLESQVDRDLRNLSVYQEHLKAATVLRQQADAAANPTEAAGLRAEALDEEALARARARFFSAAVPIPGQGQGPVEYDRAAAIQQLTDANDELRKLTPDATRELAKAQHERTDNLGGLVTLIVAALIFLTVAQFARSRARVVFAVAGAGVALATALTAGYINLFGG